MESNQTQRKTDLLNKFKKRSRPRKPWLLIMAAAMLAGCFVVVFTVYQFKTRSDIQGEAKTSAMKRDVKSVPGGDASEAYREKMREKNRREAQRAQQEGESFMPSVAGNLSEKEHAIQIPNRQQEEKQPEDTGQEKKREPSLKKVRAMERRMKEMQERIRTLQQRQQSFSKLDRSRPGAPDRTYEEKMRQYETQLARISDEMKERRTSHEIQVFAVSDDQGREPERAGVCKSGVSGPGETGGGPDPEINSGDILYARNEILLNSDAPGPAHATVLSGDYKGAKLLGGFKKQHNYLHLDFNRLILPDGREYEIESVAIDPEIPASAVRSDVNRHILSRWGGLMAASFLAGFGEAARESGSQISHSDGESYKSYPEMDTTEQLWSAAGRVGEELSSILRRNFDRPSTVTLDPDTNIGVLILSVEERN